MVLNASGDYNETIINCGLALKINDKAAKAYYLRGMAHMHLHSFEDSSEDIKTAIRLNPTDKGLRNAFE
jgi:tetratricopeptide (TPR) repeat protein